MADKARETPAHQQLTTKEADVANVRPGNMNSGEKEGGPSNVRQDLVGIIFPHKLLLIIIVH